MKKLPITQLFIIVLIVGVLAFVIFGSNNKSRTGQIKNTNTEATYSTVTGTGEDSLYEAEQKQLQEKMDSYALYNTAVDSLDISGCEKITANDTLKSECNDNVYSALASKDKDMKLCDKIIDTEIKSRCTSSFAYDTALASGIQADCDKIMGDSDLKTACVKNIVFTKIESQSFSGTVDTCSTLSGADKEYCINRIKKDSDIDLLQVATTTKDINICGQIKDTSMKNTCNDTVYMTLALEKKDGSLCAKILDNARKTTCSTQFARVNDATILSKALSENNLSLCATITTSELKTKCSDTLLLKSGVAVKDTTVCAKIVDVSIKKQCTDAVKVILDQLNKQK